MLMTTLLIIHGLVGTALLGAITHQLVGLLWRPAKKTGTFVNRYAAVRADVFTVAIVWLFAVETVLGMIIYPEYRLGVRIPFEEMGLRPAVGSFELKEHFAGLGLGILPLYWRTWQADMESTHHRDRAVLTALIAFAVWWDFLVGHILNNIRGFG